MKKLLTLTLCLLWVSSILAGDTIHVTTMRVGSVARQPFAPTTITDCSLWLAADQAELVGTGDGTQISLWTDHSPKGNNSFTNYVADIRPLFTNAAINGKPALLFDSTFYLHRFGDITNLVALDKFHLFFVLKWHPGIARPSLWIWNQQANSNLFQMQHYDGTAFLFHGGDGQGTSSGSYTALSNNTWRILEFYKTGGTTSDSASMWTNGAAVWTDTTVNTNFYAGYNATAFRLGNTANGFKGEIAEIIFYMRSLAAAEAVQVRTYFTNKYGL